MDNGETNILTCVWDSVVVKQNAFETCNVPFLICDAFESGSVAVSDDIYRCRFLSLTKSPLNCELHESSPAHHLSASPNHFPYSISSLSNLSMRLTPPAFTIPAEAFPETPDLPPSSPLESDAPDASSPTQSFPLSGDTAASSDAPLGFIAQQLAS